MVWSSNTIHEIRDLATGRRASRTLAASETGCKKNDSPAASASLSDAFDPKRNAFAFLRCVLAGLVIISHCYPLGGFGADPLEAITRRDQTLGVFAVAMFFVLSGFLIARAAANSPSVGRFVWHRFLRIFPGYWICLIVCGFVIAPAGLPFRARCNLAALLHR